MPLETTHALPNVGVDFITGEELLKKMKDVDSNMEPNDNEPSLLTILDLRTEANLPNASSFRAIKCDCPIIYCLLDDLQNPDMRNRIPKDINVVTVTETGNRDKYAIQYLSQFGYHNLSALLFGMRGWIKAGYPIAETPDRKSK